MFFNINEIINYYQIKIKRIKFAIILIFILSLFCFEIFFLKFPEYDYLLPLAFFSLIVDIMLVLILYTNEKELELLCGNDWLSDDKNKYELEHIILYCKGEYILTDKNIYLLKSQVIISYTNMLLIYRKYNIYRYFLGKSKYRALHNSFEHDQSIVIITKDKRAIKLCNDISRFLLSDDIRFSNLRFLYNQDKNVEKLLKEKKFKYFNRKYRRK